MTGNDFDRSVRANIGGARPESVNLVMQYRGTKRQLMASSAVGLVDFTLGIATDRNDLVFMAGDRLRTVGVAGQNMARTYLNEDQVRALIPAHEDLVSGEVIIILGREVAGDRAPQLWQWDEASLIAPRETERDGDNNVTTPGIIQTIFEDTNVLHRAETPGRFVYLRDFGGSGDAIDTSQFATNQQLDDALSGVRQIFLSQPYADAAALQAAIDAGDEVPVAGQTRGVVGGVEVRIVGLDPLVFDEFPSAQAVTDIRTDLRQNLLSQPYADAAALQAAIDAGDETPVVGLTRGVVGGVEVRIVGLDPLVFDEFPSAQAVTDIRTDLRQNLLSQPYADAAALQAAIDAGDEVPVAGQTRGVVGGVEVRIVGLDPLVFDEFPSAQAVTDIRTDLRQNLLSQPYADAAALQAAIDAGDEVPVAGQTRGVVGGVEVRIVGLDPLVFDEFPSAQAVTDIRTDLRQNLLSQPYADAAALQAAIDAGDETPVAGLTRGVVGGVQVVVESLDPLRVTRTLREDAIDPLVRADAELGNQVAEGFGNIRDGLEMLGGNLNDIAATQSGLSDDLEIVEVGLDGKLPLDPIVTPNTNNWLEAGSALLSTSASYLRLRDAQNPVYSNGVADATIPLGANGEPFIDFAPARQGGDFPRNPELMDLRPENGRIYEVLSDVEHYSGPEGGFQFLFQIYDAGFNRQQFEYVGGFGTQGQSRQQYKIYICADPADAVDFNGITPRLIRDSNDNTVYGTVAAGLRRVDAFQRIYRTSIRDVTNEIRMRRFFLDPRRFGCVVGDNVDAAQALRNSQAINAAWVEASGADRGGVVQLPAGPIMLDRAETVNFGIEHHYALLNPGNAKLIGAGQGLTNLRLRNTAGSINGASCHVILSTQQENTLISDLGIDGNRDNQVDGGDVGGNDPAGIIILGLHGQIMNHIDVRRCNIFNTFDYGFAFEGDAVARYANLEDLLIGNNGSDCIDVKAFGGIHRGIARNIYFIMGNKRQSQQAAWDARVGWDCHNFRISNLSGDDRGIRTVEHENDDVPAHFSNCTVEASSQDQTVAYAFQTGFVRGNGLVAKGTLGGILTRGGENISISATLINCDVPLQLRDKGPVSFDGPPGQAGITIPSSAAINGRYDLTIISDQELSREPIIIGEGCDNNHFSGTVVNYTQPIMDDAQQNTVDVKGAQHGVNVPGSGEAPYMLFSARRFAIGEWIVVIASEAVDGNGGANRFIRARVVKENSGVVTVTVLDRDGDPSEPQFYNLRPNPSNTNEILINSIAPDTRQAVRQINEIYAIGGVL